MKQIYIEIKEQNRNADFYALQEDFIRKEVEIKEVQGTAWRTEEAAVGEKEERLILTDSQETADWAKRKGLACVAYEAPETELHFRQVDMVIQSFEGVDEEFFRLICMHHWGIPWTIADTQRLLIRESVKDDFEALYELYQEPDMTDYIQKPGESKEEERILFFAYIQHMYSFFEYGLWTVIEKKSGKIIGRAGLENAEYKGQPVIELGYMIGREYQGKGYATEAVKAILSYCREALAGQALYVFIDQRNNPSLRLIQKMQAEEIPAEQMGIRTFVINEPDFSLKQKK